MSLRLKVVLLCCCLWTNLSCAADTYENNPAANSLIEELVADEGFQPVQFHGGGEV